MASTSKLFVNVRAISPTDCITSEQGISIKRRSTDTYYLFATTRSGSIFHFCEYSTVAKLRDGKLVSGAKDFCEVTVFFKDEEAFLSSEGHGCQSFCSAQASLRASNLKKKFRNSHSNGSVVRSGK
jgi:hypothetical protein